MKAEGIIIKGYSGFYYVFDAEQVWECSLRGRFRLTRQSFLPGDRVEITIIDAAKRKAVIEEVKPRQVQLERPAVANVDQAVLVMALQNPVPDLLLLDRLLIAVLAKKLKPIICFNKADLAGARIKPAEIYARTGFTVLVTSPKKNLGIDSLRENLKGCVSVFAGPSGVGKSSLLNSVEKGLTLKTGEVGEKLGRGKHTTRHVELFKLTGGGLVADTPGFSQLYLPPELKREDLREFFPEMQRHGECRFQTCLHREEPGCQVREAVAQELIDSGRYERYLLLLEEVIAKERRY